MENEIILWLLRWKPFRMPVITLVSLAGDESQKKSRGFLKELRHLLGPPVFFQP